MNGIAFRDALERAGIKTRVMSAISMSGIVEHYDRRLAIQLLSDGYVVIFTAGTGNPFFTTDTAGCLRAVETLQGFFSVQQTCSQCSGTGQIIKDKCKTCGGYGAIKENKTLSVNIPSGVDNGDNWKSHGVS